jgi:phosphomannomutase
MNKVFIFDVDGTLTPSRQPMTKEFQDFFSEWSEKNKFYLVTGSDIHKLQEQMCYFDILAQGIFTCCGNEMWIPDPHIVNISAEQVYRKEFKPPERLIKYLELELRYSPYLPKCGNHIEDRETMLNFSIIGRDCNQEQREDYNKYDTEKGERKRITEAIKRQFPELDAVIGGQISIDIYPKGNDKSQILEHIKDRNIVSTLSEEFIFIGDGIENGGNDYPLAQLMNKKDNCSTFQTDGWEHTMQILENLR